MKKTAKIFEILIALVMFVGLIQISAFPTSAENVTTHNIDHVDIAKEDGATALAVPSSATVVVTYANSDTKTLTRSGESTGTSGESQWRFTGLKNGSYIGDGNKRSDSNGAKRVVAVRINYVVNSKTYEYTLSDYSDLLDGLQNCQGHSGLDIAVLGSQSTDYFYYQVVYKYYTDGSLVHTDESGVVVQTEDTKVTLTPSTEKVYGDDTYTFDAALSDGYANVSLSSSENNPVNHVVINLAYVRNTPAPKTGELKVSKIVGGGTLDTERAFNFTATLTDADGNLLQGTLGEFTDGKATFTLKHGESKTFSQIPVGTRYTVTETDDPDYSQSSENAAGTISENETSVVTFTNTLKTGNLKITKTISGDGASSTQSFTFYAVLEDRNYQKLSGTYGGLTFDGGTAVFALKAGESKLISGLPVGTVCNVFEVNEDGYTVTVNGSSDLTETVFGSDSIIGVSGVAYKTIEYNKTLELVFNNYKDLDRADLTVKKTVSGEGAEESRAFTFTVSASYNGTPISGTYGNMTFENGKCVFTLKHGESRTATGLPVGTVYTVTESDNEGYTVTSENASGTIATTSSVTVAFNNYKDLDRADLTIKKTVSGEGAEESRAFTFTVSASYNDTPISGTYGNMTFENGKCVFTLKHGESRTATGLPVGTVYTVTESDNEGYTVTSENASGTIATTSPVTVAFNNYKDLDRADLTVKKTVSGEGAEETRAFTFTVSASYNDTPISGTYGNMTFENGKCVFTLKHGESRTATGLPVGTVYTVTESDNEGYTVTSENASGTIATTSPITVAINNHKDACGGVTVINTVTGDDPTDEEYEFTVWVRDEDGNTVDDEISYEIKDENGEISSSGTIVIGDDGYDFTLKDGESISFDKLPGGSYVEVRENTTGDFTTESIGLDDGITVIHPNTEKTVEFVNRYSSEKVPEDNDPEGEKDPTDGNVPANGSDSTAESVPADTSDTAMVISIVLALLSGVALAFTVKAKR